MPDVIVVRQKGKLNAVINGQADAMLGYSMDQNLKIEAAIHKTSHSVFETTGDIAMPGVPNGNASRGMTVPC